MTAATGRRHPGVDRAASQRHQHRRGRCGRSGAAGAAPGIGRPVVGARRAAPRRRTVEARRPVR
eukprot:15451291-Alexandrium_andersonii.AAC.1